MAPPEPSRAARLVHLPAVASAESVSQRFVTLVRDALLHLHDPPYLQTHQLAYLIPKDQVTRARGPGRALRQSLLDAIESLRPPRDASPQSHAWRAYELLRERYFEARPATDVQARLAIGSSVYHVTHRSALEGLAVLLRAAWGIGAEESLGEGRHSAALEVLSGEKAEVGRLADSPRSLPVPLTSFVGRECELAEVRGLLGRARLLTLTGAGGCGKTRLAVECARSLPNAYPDGVWLAQLAPITDSRLVPLTVAATLGIREAAEEPIVVMLIRRLQSRHCLLVLDNCEHLLDACASLADSLLGACPDVTVLATSRQALGIAGEITLRVPSLGSPPQEERSREAALQAVLTHDATRLFLDRARSTLPAFQATTANASAIGEICRRLDGIPLAIELAAARVRALSPEQIASRLDHDFHLLTSGSRTALPRQQTLKATLDWSHDLLSDRERALLRRLSVFAGGFSLEAAEGVCAGEGIAGLDVVVLLAELVDRSLVEADARERDARYRLLEPVRQYAWHRLEESGEAEDVQRRHAAWFTELVRKADDEFYGPEEARWRRRASFELDNLRAAATWCLDHNPSLGLLLATRMDRYWESRGMHGEQRHWLDEMLSRAPERTPVRASALHSAATVAADRGDYERAKSLASECLSIMLELHEERNAGWPLWILGAVAGVQGEHAEARSLLEQAEAVARKHGNAKSLAHTLIFLGYEGWLAGEYPRAREYLDEALRATCALGSAFGIAVAHLWSGGLASTERDYARARADLQAGIEGFRSIGDPATSGWCICQLGYVSLAEGDFERAQMQVSDALVLTARASQRPMMARSLAYLALLAIRRGDANRAARLVGAGEAIYVHLRTSLPPDQLAELDACLTEARSALGEEAFGRVWNEGQAMTLEQAVESALSGGAREKDDGLAAPSQPTIPPEETAHSVSDPTRPRSRA